MLNIKIQNSINRALSLHAKSILNAKLKNYTNGITWFSNQFVPFLSIQFKKLLQGKDNNNNMIVLPCRGRSPP